VTRFGLFLSSYAPLFGILAVRFTDPWLAATCFAVAALGVIMARWILFAHADEAAVAPITATSVEDVGSQATTYLATYLLPFVALEQPGPRDVIAYALFFTVAALIYVRSDMLQVNPTFYLLGRRIVKVTSKGGRMLYAISSQRVFPGELTGVELTPGILLVTDDTKS
jgi:hypothetical protein